MAERSAEEIRASIEQNREALGESLGAIRDEVVSLTDWRSHLRENLQPLIIGAAGTGFLLGGGVEGTFSLVFGRRRRKRAKRERKALKKALKQAAAAG